MKKAATILVAVAILGALALFNSKHSGNARAGGDAVQTAPTTVAQNETPITTTPAQSASSNSAFKDGTYTGTSVENPYGFVQVAAVISGGKIVDINFLKMPGPEQHSKEVTAFSQPLLKNSALSKQSANVDFVSGATDTAISFKESMQAALNKANQ